MGKYVQMVGQCVQMMRKTKIIHISRSKALQRFSFAHFPGNIFFLRWVNQQILVRMGLRQFVAVWPPDNGQC
jgi:hypothetical protein